MQYLEFEKPIQTLTEEILKLKEMGEKTKVDMSEAIQKIELKIVETQKDLYPNLNDWQKVQLMAIEI